MSPLNFYYNNFLKIASGLPGGFIEGQKEDVPYDIDILVNGYCDAVDNKNEILKNQYISALMVRYWHMVVKLYKTSKSTRMDPEEFIMWLYDAIEKACSYRSWKDKNKNISKDPKGAEKCINQCITSIRAYWYNYFNKDKRKINYQNVVDSLDRPLFENDSENNMTLLDSIASTDDESINVCSEIIQQYLDKGDILTALVLDGIVYHDSFVTTIKVKNKTIKDSEDNDMEIKEINTKNTFVQTKLIKHLTTLNKDFEDYFYNKYKVDKDSFKEIILNINKLTDSALLRRVKKSINLVKNNMEVKKALCI